MELINNNASVILIQCPYTEKRIHEKFEDCYVFTTGDIKDIYEYREYLNALGYRYPGNIG